jgi:hypothetical protein
VDKKVGVIKYAKNQSTKNVIKNVADLYHEWIETGVRPSQRKWNKVRNAANAANAASAADIADPAYDADYYADYHSASAADSANSASAADYTPNAARADNAINNAVRAIYNAVDAAICAAALRTREQAFSIQAKKLLKLLAAAPITEI